MTDGYDWILPAVIIVGWILSWWGPRGLRWGLLAVATVLSILCVPMALLVPMTPVNPNTSCRPVVQCTSLSPLYWVMAGLIGFGCCIALSILTLAIEPIVAALVRSRVNPSGDARSSR